MRRNTAAVLLGLLMGSLMAVMPATAAPAATAAVEIRNAASGACLLQEYNRSNLPTTGVSTADTCPAAAERMWRFEFVGGDAYRVVNNRSGWCLSAPNGSGSRVFTEYCVTPLPAKQTWTPVWTAYGDNVLINAASGECLSREADRSLWVRYCYADVYTPGVHWVWS